MEKPLDRLAELAQRQHGIVSLDDTRRLGIGRHAVDRLVASRRLVRIAPRAFLVNGAPPTWCGRILAECRSAGTDAVASHRTAATLWNLAGFDPPRIVHLTLPRGRRPAPRPDVRLHLSHDFDLVARTTRQGVPVTGVARTLLDLCGAEPNPAVARRALHSARQQKLVTWSELRACLDAHARPGRRGVPMFRALLERHAGAGAPESALEDLVLELILDAGLPRPRVQHTVVAGGRRYRFDAAYPEFRLGIECKGKGHHFTEEAFECDPMRENALQIAGWHILVFTWDRYRHDPAGIVAEIEAALRARGADLRPALR